MSAKLASTPSRPSLVVANELLPSPRGQFGGLLALLGGVVGNGT